MPQISLEELRDANQKRQKEWKADKGELSLEFRALEFGGEVGELLNLIKKLRRHELGIVGNNSLRVDKIHAMLSKEIGDCLITLDLLASALGFNLGGCACHAFNKTSQKLGFHTRLLMTLTPPGTIGPIVPGRGLEQSLRNSLLDGFESIKASFPNRGEEVHVDLLAQTIRKYIDLGQNSALRFAREIVRLLTTGQVSNSNREGDLLLVAYAWENHLQAEIEDSEL